MARDRRQGSSYCPVVRLVACGRARPRSLVRLPAWTGRSLRGRGDSPWAVAMALVLHAGDNAIDGRSRANLPSHATHLDAKRSTFGANPRRSRVVITGRASNRYAGGHELHASCRAPDRRIVVRALDRHDCHRVDGCRHVGWRLIRHRNDGPVGHFIIEHTLDGSFHIAAASSSGKSECSLCVIRCSGHAPIATDRSVLCVRSLRQT